MSQYQTTWNNHHFFTGSDDPAIANIVSELKAEIPKLAKMCSPFADKIERTAEFTEIDIDKLIPQIRAIHKQRIQIVERLHNTMTFINSAASVDAKDENATGWIPTLQQVGAELQKAMKPLSLFLIRSSDNLLSAVEKDPILEELAFWLKHQRKLQDQFLSVAEERVITGLAVDGLHAWGNLYDELAGTLKCEIAGESVGLAKAANLLTNPDRSMREQAWRGINCTWSQRENTAAFILNSINGWRLEESKQRSQQRELHYLDKSCHQSRIERATLDALMQTTYQNRSIGHRALKTMSKVLQIPQAAPWDLMALPPNSNDTPSISFDDAIDLIANAFRGFDPAMGDFVVMMAQKGWIDGQPTPNRTTGAYCTKFFEPREPRVFLTFEGTLSNVMTLAHELGHAWHNWVMRDLPIIKTIYPMTLAETASIFAETLIRNALYKKATTVQQKLDIVWQDAIRICAFLLNIPARFEFEKQLVEARKNGFVKAESLKKMMRNSWQLWYEDTLCEYDEMFWASKLHFSISDIGFYNYPYLFGYLFSLGIYAQQQNYSNGFAQRYTSILQDTGIMTVEELVNRYLQQDVRQVQFWQDSLNMVDGVVNQFENLAEKL